MFNCVIGNLNSEQLFWAWSENPKLKHLGLQNLSHTQHNIFLTQKGFTSLSGGGSCFKKAPKNVIQHKKILIPSYQKL